MNTVHDIFDTFGGTGAVARIINVKHSAASEMRRRQSIPVKYWPSLIERAKEIGASLDSDALVRVHLPSSEAAA